MRAPSSAEAPPPLDVDTIREGLDRAVKQHGLQPPAGWVAVRVVKRVPERLYSVTITYEPLRIPLASVLSRHYTGSIENDTAGIWVLTESEARSLCDGRSPDGRWVRV